MTYDEFCRYRANIIELLTRGQLTVFESNIYMMALNSAWAAQQELCEEAACTFA